MNPYITWLLIVTFVVVFGATVFALVTSFFSLRQLQRAYVRSEQNQKQLKRDLDELSAGLALELRSEKRPFESEQEGKVVEDRFETLQAALDGLTKSASLSTLASDSAINQTLSELSPLARALLFDIVSRVRRHLTVDQYKKLLKINSVGSALLELRATGMLAPLVSSSEEEVYYVPGRRFSESVAQAVAKIQVPNEARRVARASLDDVGYKQRALDGPEGGGAQS